jgi:N-acetylglutamate synthase-like GNAT family acetyltransferase
MMVRPADASDRDWIACTLVQRWGSTTIVTRGRLCDAASLAALVAVDATCEHEPARVGLLTYRVDRAGLEVVTVDALKAGVGIGTALLSGGVLIARNAGVGRVWLITTNDNLTAQLLQEERIQGHRCSPRRG